MKYLSYLLIGIVIVIAGCSSGDDELSITEKKRLEVDQRAGRFLLDAHQAYEQGSFSLALAFTDSAEYYASDLADIHYLRGLIYARINDNEISSMAFDVTLELDPEYPGARYGMALNAFRGDRLRDAINLFHQEIELGGGKTSLVMHELGRTYAKLGEPDSARMAYEEAVELDSTNATAIMWLGQLHEEMGEYDRALEYSFRGIEMNPDHLDYQYIVGTQLYRVDRIEEAFQYLKNVADTRPWHHGAQYNLAQVLVRLGREEEAQRYLVLADSAQQMTQRINDARDKTDTDPSNIEHWIVFAEHLRYSGNYEKAIEAYQTAVSMEPYNMYLQANLAMLWMENGDYERAIRRYTAILNFDSTLVDVWLNLGVAYANAGYRSAAETSWLEVLEDQPDHRAAREYMSRLDEIGEGSNAGGEQ